MAAGGSLRWRLLLLSLLILSPCTIHADSPQNVQPPENVDPSENVGPSENIGPSENAVPSKNVDPSPNAGPLEIVGFSENVGLLEYVDSSENTDSSENVDPLENVDSSETDDHTNETTYVSDTYTSYSMTADSTILSTIPSDSTILSTTPSSTSRPITTTPPPTTTATIFPPPTSDEDRYQRTKNAFSKIDTNLTDFEDKLIEADAGVRAKLLHPLAFRFQAEPDKQTRVATVDDICKSWLTPLCRKLRTSLDSIENMATTFNLDANLWTDTQLYYLEEESKNLDNILSNDQEKLIREVDKDKFEDYFDNTMDELLKEAIQNAQHQVDDINKRDKDAIVFVSVLGAIGGLLVVALVAGFGFVCYKASTLNKNKDDSKKSKTKKPGKKIPMEPPQSAYEPEPYRLGPAPQPLPRSSTDLYSRPHAPKSERYYTADEVNSRYGGGRQQSYQRRNY